jgi:hypothetical protein
MAAVLPSSDNRPSRQTRESTPKGRQSKSQGDKRGWLGSIFSREVKIKRIGKQLHVVLEDSKARSTLSRSGGRGEALRLAHQALQTTLDQHDDARRMMPHLHHLERSMAQEGSRALKTLPINVMQKAMVQLELIEGSAQSDDLITLRLRVEEAIKRRAPARLKDDMSAIEVTDASHSQFDEADRIWTGVAPLDEAEPAPPAK